MVIAWVGKHRRCRSRQACNTSWPRAVVYACEAITRPENSSGRRCWLKGLDRVQSSTRRRLRCDRLRPNRPLTANLPWVCTFNISTLVLRARQSVGGTSEFALASLLDRHMFSFPIRCPSHRRRGSSASTLPVRLRRGGPPCGGAPCWRCSLRRRVSCRNCRRAAATPTSWCVAAAVEFLHACRLMLERSLPVPSVGTWALMLPFKVVC